MFYIGIQGESETRVAYGKSTTKGFERRMADLGRGPVTADLAKLRLLYIEACGILADSIWPQSILEDLPGGKTLDGVMLRAQSGLRGTLNSVWAEKARLSAKAAVLEQRRRARGNLFGRFKHLSTAGERPLPDGRRRLVNFPVEVSNNLSESGLAALQAMADSMDFAGVMQLFRKIEGGAPVSALSQAQADALRGMLTMVKERFGKPQWSVDDAVVQMHLDFRCMSGGRVAQDSLLRQLDQAAQASFSNGMGDATSWIFVR